MVDELTISANLDFAKGGVSASMSKSRAQLDVAGSRYTRGVQTVGITEQALLIGDLPTPGYCLIVNPDATNFVSIRNCPGAPAFAEVPAGGGVALFKVASGVALYGIADTAPVGLEYLIVEA